MVPDRLVSALLVARERPAGSVRQIKTFTGSVRSIQLVADWDERPVRFVESNQFVHRIESNQFVGSNRSIELNEMNDRQEGNAPQSPLDQGAVIELTGRLPKVSFIC